jgi:hypothetical protein
MAGITGPAPPLMERTAARTIAKAITLPLELTRAAARSPRPMGARQPARRTTQGPGPMAPRSKPPTPMAAPEARSIQRTAIRRTASTRRRPMVPRDRYRLPTVAKLMQHRARTATAPLRAKRPTATNTRQRTATSTRTQGAGGRKTTTEAGTTSRSLAPVRLLRTVGEAAASPIAAGHRPLAEADGNPGRTAIVVFKAAAVVVDGVAGRANSARRANEL